MFISIILLKNKDPQNPNNYWVVPSPLFVKHLNMRQKIFTNEPLKDIKVRFKEVHRALSSKLNATPFPVPEINQGHSWPMFRFRSTLGMKVWDQNKCKQKAKEFRDTETLIIMLLLLPLVILTDVAVHWKDREGRGTTGQKERMETKSSWKDMANNGIHLNCSQLSSWLAGDSGVNNSNPWPSTKSEGQFLVEFTYSLSI